MTLSASHLSVALGGNLVVEDASLAFAPNKVTAILGPNGAGKTSLIRALAGLIAPSSGEIMLDGAPLPDLRERARRIGYLSQNGAPAWNVNVREFVGLGRLPHRSRFARPSGADEAAIDAALLATDTDAFAERTVDALSGGERARVKLARVIAGAPDWIIADEPLANLDPPHQRDVLKLLREAAARGTGVIIVLHQLNAALRAAHDVVLMKTGRVIAHGPVSSALNAQTLQAAFDMQFDLINHESATVIAPRDA